MILAFETLLESFVNGNFPLTPPRYCTIRSIRLSNIALQVTIRWYHYLRTTKVGSSAYHFPYRPPRFRCDVSIIVARNSLVHFKVRCLTKSLVSIIMRTVLPHDSPARRCHILLSTLCHHVHHPSRYAASVAACRGACQYCGDQF